MHFFLFSLFLSLSLVSYTYNMRSSVSILSDCDGKCVVVLNHIE